MENLTQYIEFDLLIMLSIINDDKILLKMFNENVSVDMKMVTYQYKNGLLSEKIESYIKELFESIILKNEDFMEKYLSLIKTERDNLTHTKTNIPETKEYVKDLPKHFGKKKVLEKIANQGFTTPLDTLMLTLNDLRNAYSKRLKMGIHDIFREEKKLSEEKILELNEIIKKAINDINK